MSLLKGWIRDGIARVVHVDMTSGALEAIDTPHAAVHKGWAFSLSRPVTLPAGLDDEIRLATPDSDVRVHFIMTVLSDAAVTVSLYETTSLTHNAGNALTPINRDRNSSATSDCTVCHTPGGSGDGSLIWSGQAGANNFLSTMPGDSSSRIEFVLKKNTAYLIRVAGAENDVVTTNLEWYEYEHRS